MPDETAPPLFSAELTPHRALGLRGRPYVIGAMLAAGLFPVLLTLARIAWPLALAVLLAVVILVVLQRRATSPDRRREQLTLWPDRLHLVQVNASGVATNHSFNPFLVRLIVDRDFDEQTTALHLRSSTGDLEIGAFLDGDDKSSFAKVFGTALKRARISSVKTGS